MESKVDENYQQCTMEVRESQEKETAESENDGIKSDGSWGLMEMICIYEGWGSPNPEAYLCFSVKLFGSRISVMRSGERKGVCTRQGKG